ncbi:sugar phosphate isomerase/epimerase [soil metagenome]
MSRAPAAGRLSINQKTIEGADLPAAVAACAEAGVGGIGLWREKVAEVGAQEATRLVGDAGLLVTSLCRGGFFTVDTPDRAARAADNRQAVEEAAAVGTDVLVLVCGGMNGLDLDSARRLVLDGIEALLPAAAECGVRLAIEPLHPMFCADRSVVVTLGQALDIAERFDAAHVGVVVDAYHVWWDPEVEAQIARAAGRILSFQICDWLVPLPDPLLGRGLPGEGCIDLRRLGRAVAATGYDGLVEVEVFNRTVWARPAEETIRDLVDRFDRLTGVGQRNRGW